MKRHVTMVGLFSVSMISALKGGAAMEVRIDPITRYVHLTYAVPREAPQEVIVRCTWSSPEKEEWKPARVYPLMSDTALRLSDDNQWHEWLEQGRVIERRAAGLKRTVVFNPYPEAQAEGSRLTGGVNGKVDIEFRVEIQTLEGETLSTQQARVQTDNSDVIYIEDWSKVMQQEAVVSGGGSGERKWSFRTGQDASAGVTFGNALYGKYTDDIPLPQLTYPLNLRGYYAIFFRNVGRAGSMRLRLSGDEWYDQLSCRHPGAEVFWRWARLDHQHLVLKQPHTYTGYAFGHIDYLRLVPLTDEQVRQLENQFTPPPDKIVAGYFEPYSWAFVEDVQETLQHRQPLAAFAQARVRIVDIQIGRFGAKKVYETRVADQLLASTIGDPIGGVVPKTSNVGRMQQFTNTLTAELRYARELGMKAHANFGATNCYPGTPLQGDISREHPEWTRNGWALRWELPQVQEHILRLYREALELGAPGISVDFCRYPEGIDKPETCTAVLRKLKSLRQEFAHARGEPVPLLIRFPAKGVRLWQNFDYPTWIKEGLVDYLCPSNIQARHLHFDIAPYVKAVRGTAVKLLPVVDGLDWGPVMPGMFLWRVKQLYDAGVHGIYIYQADGRVLNRPDDRRCVSLVVSRKGVDEWWKREAKERPSHSKGIYITPSHDGNRRYHKFERVRIWLEGVPLGAVEVYLDGKLINKFEGPPYLLGSEENDSDNLITPGEHLLRVRAKDGDGWLEQSFTIYGAG